MDNEFDNELKDESQSEGQQNHDEIPSWLQGLEDQEQGEPEVSKPNRTSDDEWIKEVDKNDVIGKDTSDHLLQPERMDQELPEWLSEMAKTETGHEDNIIEEAAVSESSSEEFEASNNEELDLEVPPNHVDASLEINIGMLTESSHDLNQEPESDNQSEKGFIEISEFDIQEVEMIAEDQPDKGTQGSELLPAEFNETFTISPESSPLMEDTDQKDFPTQPVPVKQEDAGLEAEIHPVEAAHPPLQESAEKTYVDEPETEIVSEDIPGDLDQAKEFLREKKFSDAANILGQYVEQAQYLPQIKSLLDETTQEEVQEDSCIWELSGDIALKSNRLEEAIHAYTKALQILLKTDR